MTLPLSVWTTGRPVPGAEKRRGSFFGMIRQAIGPSWELPFSEVDCLGGQRLPEPDEVAGVIITGSAARVLDRERWMLEVEAALRRFRATRTPVLGICFGHQLMGMAFGGASGPNPRGREIGTYPLTHLEDDPLVRLEEPRDLLPRTGEEAERVAPGAFESEAESAARRSGHVVMTHLDSVTQLPPGSQRLAETELEPNAAIRFEEAIWGVQFHPEMDAEIIGHYLEERRPDIEAEGLDVDQLLQSRSESLYGRALLQRFARFCAQRA